MGGLVRQVGGGVADGWVGVTDGWVREWQMGGWGRQGVPLVSFIYPVLSSCTDEELNRHGDLCLVDFDRKLYEQVCACILCVQVVTMVMESAVSMQAPPPLSDGRISTAPQVARGDEWVEYVDSLGRTRKCLKTDLHELTHLDREGEEGLGEGQVEGVGEGLSSEVEQSRPDEEHYQTVLQRGERVWQHCTPHRSTPLPVDPTFLPAHEDRVGPTR